MNIIWKKQFLLLLISILLLAFAPSVTDCRGGRGGGGRSSGGSRSSSSSRSSYSSSYSYSSSSRSYSGYSYGYYYSPSSYSYIAVYRPAYYYYSYTYNNYVYEPEYYGNPSTPVNSASIIIPIAIVGGIFLMLIIMVVIAKCTDRTVGQAICCVFFCQCSKEETEVVEKTVIIKEEEHEYYDEEDDNNGVEQVSGLNNNFPVNGYQTPANPDMSMYPSGMMVNAGSANTSVISGYPMAQVHPQMGMYPAMGPQGFSTGMQGGAIVSQTYQQPQYAQ